MTRDGDPYPWTWEVPAACLAALVGVSLVGLQAGRSMAFVTAGRGWVWPPSDQLLVSVPPLLSGVTNAGLPTGVAPVPTGLFVAFAVATEVIGIAGCALLCWQLLIRFGPGAITGLASAAEAARLLGRARLMRDRKVVRPDLYIHPAPPRASGSAP